mmetsp:Transcript_52851/g.125158  ORF Transcript_52851/g.125158 Transcript_52851/m.125158 type:complete len:377 (-) Transcript_52851:323-1453(-)
MSLACSFAAAISMMCPLSGRGSGGTMTPGWEQKIRCSAYLLRNSGRCNSGNISTNSLRCLVESSSSHSSSSSKDKVLDSTDSTLLISSSSASVCITLLMRADDAIAAACWCNSRSLSSTISCFMRAISCWSMASACFSTRTSTVTCLSISSTSPQNSSLSSSAVSRWPCCICIMSGRASPLTISGASRCCDALIIASNSATNPLYCSDMKMSIRPASADRIWRRALSMRRAVHCTLDSPVVSPIMVAQSSVSVPRLSGISNVGIPSSPFDRIADAFTDSWAVDPSVKTADPCSLLDSLRLWFCSSSHPIIPSSCSDAAEDGVSGVFIPESGDRGVAGGSHAIFSILCAMEPNKPIVPCLSRRPGVRPPPSSSSSRP